MAYNALNNLIDAYIYANGVQAITGQILNGVLKQMVAQLGSGYHLMGVAGPETVPASNDYAMAYFAATAGEYTDFGGITLAPGEVAVLLTFGNGSWEKRTIYNVPTGTADLENTANFITNAVTDLVNYYTKTEVDDTLADYPTLEALATALADYYTKQEIDTILAGYTTNTALASALADYYNKNDIDGLLSVVNAALADRYTKSETDTKLADYYKKTETYDKDEVDSIVAALSRQEYIVAWDGLATPDIAAIPAGVTVTYSGTTYTGTLAASADTVNKIYMVWNGTAYDMYGTSQDGGYSWVPMGTTTVDLSQYATKAEVSQLEAKVTDLYGEYIENPEYIRVYTDADNRILWAIKNDGTAYAAAGFEAHGAVSLDGEDINVIDNPEFVYVRLDNDGKVLYGVQKDGNIIFGCGVPSQIVAYIEERISDLSLDEYEDIVAFLGNLVNGGQTLDALLNGKVDKEQGKSLISEDVASRVSFVENPEFISVETDNNGKVLSARDNGGVKVEFVGNETPSMNIDGNKFDNIQDNEDRIEVKTDAENKVVSFREKNGVLVENVGIETPSLKADTLEVRDVKYSGIPDQTTETVLYFDKPKFADFYFYGVLPTDKSDNRTPTTLDFVCKVNGKVLLSSKCTLSIQGHGSINFPKLGYTFEPLNANGDALEIKWGDMIAADSFHLKAYYTDRTQARDCGGARIWRNMVRHLSAPFDKVNNKPLDISDGQKIDRFCIADAKYCVDGFPVAFYLNDNFHGLYTIKLKKNRKNYAMQKDNKSEIFLDCLGFDVSVGHSAKLQDPFDAGAWDLKNPKIKNYEEGGEITDATVLANIERLFTFTNNLATMYAQHQDYIVLPHWICWVIFSELVGNIDVDGNNLELLTWDATHWSLIPYDLDTSVGLYNAVITVSNNNSPVLNYTFYNTFKNCYETEIKQTYAELRNSHCLDIDVLYNTYIEQVSCIPRNVYEDDIKKWPNTYWSNGFPVIEQIYSYLQSRLEYLDSIWLNS